ncbi:type I restriction endonuclease [Parabacteroides pacaensis]|uniref:type I restriction endonuclease n=1 Tax=Parabacteroides pacaensis TaxID=2086575 RepID=UPI000D0E5D5B|nr:type I restriction endonuclease [Parabacteroides pacaensis]
MDFKDTLLQLADKIAKQKEAIQTEEATKASFIMPMIAALGYDIFNPFEVIPEMDCDLIKKKGEKIDYAIMKDDSPILLIECKHCKQDLNLHDTQLQKYFVASNARFGVLTNGIEYRFYTDLEKVNLMDEKPFLIVNMLDLSDNDIEQLKKFHKSYYDESNILSTASELKYTTEIKSILNKEFIFPTPDFVKFFVKQVYDGQATQKVVEQFTPILKKSIASVVNDIISDRLNVAIKSGEQQDVPTTQEATQPAVEDVLPDGVVVMDEKKGIVTTQEEIDAYNIIRSILRKHISADKIVYKDFKSYFAIGIENSSYWWICRLSFGSRKKLIWFPTEGYKSQEKIELENIDGIFDCIGKLEQAFDIANNAYEAYKNKHEKK